MSAMINWCNLVKDGKSFYHLFLHCLVVLDAWSLSYSYLLFTVGNVCSNVGFYAFLWLDFLSRRGSSFLSLGIFGDGEKSVFESSLFYPRRISCFFFLLGRRGHILRFQFFLYNLLMILNCYLFWGLFYKRFVPLWWFILCILFPFRKIHMYLRSWLSLSVVLCLNPQIVSPSHQWRPSEIPMIFSSLNQENPWRLLVSEQSSG